MLPLLLAFFLLSWLWWPCRFWCFSLVGRMGKTLSLACVQPFLNYSLPHTLPSPTGEGVEVWETSVEKAIWTFSVLFLFSLPVLCFIGHSFQLFFFLLYFTFLFKWQFTHFLLIDNNKKWNSRSNNKDIICFIYKQNIN